MRTRLFRRPGAGFAPARHATMALCIGVAIVSLAGALSGQDAQRAPAPQGASVPQALVGRGGREPLPPSDARGEFIYNEHTGVKVPAYRGKAPEGKPTKPWTGAFLPDGQPDVPEGIWRIPSGATIYLDKAQGANRATRVADPPDGKVPYQPWAQELKRTADYDLYNPTRPWHVDTQHRCISSIPRMYYYVAPYKIYQPPGHIVFRWHNYRVFRVIPLDGRPHIGSNIKLWYGDAVGRWEGNTLIVDTANLNANTLLTSGGDFLSSNAHLTEKFIFEPDAKTMIYEVTVDDPKVLTRPYTMRVVQQLQENEEIWEYQCGAGDETGSRPSSQPGTQP